MFNLGLKNAVSNVLKREGIVHVPIIYKKWKKQRYKNGSNCKKCFFGCYSKKVIILVQLQFWCQWFFEHNTFVGVLEAIATLKDDFT